MGNFELSEIARYAGIVTLVALFVAITAIALRAKSWHFARLRLWRFAHGKGEVKDPRIKALLDDEADLAQFRYFLMGASNIYEARDFITWLSEVRIQPHQIRACGSYFDRGRKALVSNLPSRRWTRASFVILTWILGALLTLSVMAAGSSAAILRFKQSGQWFLLYQDSALALFRGNSVALGRDQCNPPVAIDPRVKFTSSDRASICEIFNDKTLPAYIQSNRESQRWSFGGLALLILFALTLHWRHLSRVEASWQLKRYLAAES
jgi:Family of unknown function (DUF6216)